MPPIRIHTASPINASSGQSSDESTINAAQGDTLVAQPSATPTTQTADNSSYPSARPGAPSVPAPTGAPRLPVLQPPPTRTSAYAQPSNPYAPSSSTSSSPPPPQPGAVPMPPTASPSVTSEARKLSIPPPPKAGEAVQPSSYYAPQYPSPSATPTQAAQPPPPLPAHQQTAMMDSPYRAQPPASTTTTMGSRPPLGGDPGGLNGPPGYVQNTTSAFQDRPVEPYNPFATVSQGFSSGTGSTGLGSGGGSSNYSGVLGSGGAGPSSYPAGIDDAKEGLNNVWNTAVSWAQKAGEKLQEGEAEVWRRINNNNDK